MICALRTTELHAHFYNNKTSINIFKKSQFFVCD